MNKTMLALAASAVAGAGVAPGPAEQAHHVALEIDLGGGERGGREGDEQADAKEDEARAQRPSDHVRSGDPAGAG